MDNLVEVQRYRDRLRIALKVAKICVFEVDLKNQLYTFFENAEDIFGVSGDVILKDVEPFSKLSPSEYQKAASEYFSHPDDAAVVDEAFKSILSGKPITYQARMRAAGSDFMWCKLDVMPILEDGVPAKMIGVITDISDINKKINDLRHSINIDSFTGLYNKNYSIESINKVLHAKSNQRHALVLFDIDRFKFVNDTYGHYIGDLIIKSIADDLKNGFSKKNIIGRFGGDEFILLLRDIPDKEWVSKKIRKLTRCGNGRYSCSNSIGISIYPDDGKDFDSLFKNADKALYESKRVRETFTFFSEINES